MTAQFEVFDDHLAMDIERARMMRRIKGCQNQNFHNPLCGEITEFDTSWREEEMSQLEVARGGPIKIFDNRHDFMLFTGMAEQVIPRKLCASEILSFQTNS